MMVPSAWDRSTAARAAGVAAITAAVALLVITATDEGGPWALRLGMLAALGPAAGAIGALVVIRVAAARGELGALGAMGVHPLRGAIGAAAGGAVVGAIGPAAAAIGLADLAALFPRPAGGHRWIAEGDGMRDLVSGLRVGAGGVIELGAPASAGAITPAAAALPAAVAALFAAAIAAPLWVAASEERGPARRAAVGGIAIAAAIVSFQAVAAGRAPPVILLAAPLCLFLDAGLTRYRARTR